MAGNFPSQASSNIKFCFGCNLQLQHRPSSHLLLFPVSQSQNIVFIQLNFPFYLHLFNWIVSCFQRSFILLKRLRFRKFWFFSLNILKMYFRSLWVYCERIDCLVWEYSSWKRLCNCASSMLSWILPHFHLKLHLYFIALNGKMRKRNGEKWQ